MNAMEPTMFSVATDQSRSLGRQVTQGFATTA